MTSYRVHNPYRSPPIGTFFVPPMSRGYGDTLLHLFFFFIDTKNFSNENIGYRNTIYYGTEEVSIILIFQLIQLIAYSSLENWKGQRHDSESV
jgi:hypothetical protein